MVLNDDDTLAFPPGTSDDAKCFVMDYSMNKVSKYLRLLGYDVLCSRETPQREIIRISATTGRCVVTCSHPLAEQVRAHNAAVARRNEWERTHARKRRVVAYDSDGDSIYSEDSIAEAAECPLIEIPQWNRANFSETFIRLLQVTQLQYQHTRVFSRCVSCNDVLVYVPKESVESRVEPSIYRMYNGFTECPSCKKVFWGFDGERVINYKTYRTLELLRSYCESAGVPVSTDTKPLNQLTSFRSFPRAVKSRIFSFLEDDELAVVAQVLPILERLTAEVVESRRTGKEVPLFKHIKTAK